jgi:chromosome segregation ATPase
MCAVAGAAAQLRVEVAERDKRVQDLVLDVGTAKAYKAETDMITDELATQRKRYSELTTELAKCKYALENETLAKSSALSEKEGLWEVHERLVATSARLQAQLKDAEDDCSRLQEQSAERSALKEKVKHVQAERDEQMVQISKLEGQLLESKSKVASLEDELKRNSNDALAERAAIENTQGQMYEIREQLKLALHRVAEAQEECTRGKFGDHLLLFCLGKVVQVLSQVAQPG